MVNPIQPSLSRVGAKATKMPEVQAGGNPASHAAAARRPFAELRTRGPSSPQERDKSQGDDDQECGDNRAEHLLTLGPIRKLADEDAAKRLAEDEGGDQQDDDDMRQVGAQPCFSTAGATGAPAFFHAPKPPPICATGFSPISCAASAASAERQPPPQKKTKRRSCWKIGLA